MPEGDGDPAYRQRPGICHMQEGFLPVPDDGMAADGLLPEYRDAEARRKGGCELERGHRAAGKAHFRPRNYTGRDGQERQSNDVVRFIDYEPSVDMTPVNDMDVPW